MRDGAQTAVFYGIRKVFNNANGRIVFLLQSSSGMKGSKQRHEGSSIRAKAELAHSTHPCACVLLARAFTFEWACE
eukprot:5465020-Pleurochrysis_carterae.AAC.1